MRKLHWCLVLAVTACSPYPFSKEVSDFNTGVDQLSDAFVSGYAQLSADKYALMRQKQIDDMTPIIVPQSCGRLVTDDPRSKEPCVLLGAHQSAPAPTPAEQTEGDTTRQVKLLTGYAHALAAVANAADRASFDAAAKRLSTQIGQFASAAGPGVGAAAPPVLNLISWLVGAGLDKERLDALRSAVIAAEKPVHDAGTALHAGLEMIQRERIKLLYQMTGQLAEPLNPLLPGHRSPRRLLPAEYKERFLEAEAARVKLDAVRLSAAATAADKMVKAHSDLAVALQNPDGDLTQVISALQDFVAHAKAANDALAAPAK